MALYSKRTKGEVMKTDIIKTVAASVIALGTIVGEVMLVTSGHPLSGWLVFIAVLAIIGGF
jgi:hypothetical protein